MKFLVLFLFFVSVSFAQTTSENRTNSFGSVMVGYQPFATWVPSKKTISYTQIVNQSWSAELEYSWASISVPGYIDLGGISEKRYSLMAKRYFGNSFHLDFGAFYNDLEAKLGNDILQNYLGQNTSTQIGVEGVGALIGIGNRWQWVNGLTLGVDWIRVNVPVATTDTDEDALSYIGSSSDRSNIKDYINKFNHIPTFVLLGLNLGYTF